MPLFSSVMPRAEAALWEDKLAEVAAGKTTAEQLKDLRKIQQTLNQDNKQVWEMLAQAALERTGKADIFNELTNVTHQLPVQESGNSKASLINAVENAMRDKLQTTVNNRLAEYQDKLTLFTALLNASNTLTPKAVQSNDQLAGEPQNYRKLISMTATAYGPGKLDNGKWDNLTYVGSTVKKGIVAVDPTVIPMGTKLWIEGYGQAVADDQGRAIKGNRIDLAFNTRQEALDYGIQNVKVYVLN